MSAIALAWVATVKVGNQTAKQLLQFYACHNFHKPGYEFKNETLANQLEVEVRSIQRAHDLLVEKNLIKREPRYNKEGRQISSTTYLNIPDEFVDNFMGEGDIKSSLGVTLCQGEGDTVSPLYNNNINNKLNNKKHFVDQKINKPVDNSYHVSNHLTAIDTRSNSYIPIDQSLKRDRIHQKIKDELKNKINGS